jgi:hypothetical protein
VKLIDVSTPTFPSTFAKVDDSDYEALSAFKWSASKPHNVVYVVRGVTVDGKQTTIRMHQQILGDAIAVDHIDGDGLNNQRANLRKCTDQQNGQNRRKTHGRSKFKGVSWHKGTRKWRATIVADGRQRALGYFDCEGCAAIAYDRAAKRSFGEFACPNSYL